MDSQKVLLVAQDDMDRFATLEERLSESCPNYQIVHFSDAVSLVDFLLGKGREFYQAASSNFLVLIDLVDSSANGLDIVRQIRSEPSLRGTPIIMMTESGDVETVNHFYDSGGSFFVVKPEDYASFRFCIDKVGSFLSLPNVKIPSLST